MYSTYTYRRIKWQRLGGRVQLPVNKRSRITAVKRGGVKQRIKEEEDRLYILYTRDENSDSSPKFLRQWRKQTSAARTHTTHSRNNEYKKFHVYAVMSTSISQEKKKKKGGGYTFFLCEEYRRETPYSTNGREVSFFLLFNRICVAWRDRRVVNTFGFFFFLCKLCTLFLFFFLHSRYLWSSAFFSFQGYKDQRITLGENLIVWVGKNQLECWLYQNLPLPLCKAAGLSWVQVIGCSTFFQKLKYAV